MTLRRLHIGSTVLPDNKKPSIGDIISLPLTEAKHGVVVLRLKKDDKVLLLSDLGEAEAIVINSLKKGKNTSLTVELLSDFTHKDPIYHTPNTLSSIERPADTFQDKSSIFVSNTSLNTSIDTNIHPQNLHFPVLALSILRRPSAFEFAVEKSVELGANTFIPIQSSRVINKELSMQKIIRYQKIAVEAQKQSGRTQPFTILPPQKLSFFLKTISLQYGTKEKIEDKGTFHLCSAKETTEQELEAQELKDQEFKDQELKDPELKAQKKKYKKNSEEEKANSKPFIKNNTQTGSQIDHSSRLLVLLDPNGSPLPSKLPKDTIFLIGPEGGFSIEEKEEILYYGFQSFSLGSRTHILRSETAAIASLAILANRI
jgi:RsmE family RNA methyltransferase